jgi:ribosomal protein L22
MEEQKSKQTKKVKEEAIKSDFAPKTETKVEEQNKETEKEKKTEVKKEKKTGVKKDKAIIKVYSLHISMKHSKFICKMLMRKSPDKALEILDKISKGKLAVKMTGLEVPHQKGKGIAGARFPITAAKVLYPLVKQLKANALVNGIEEPIITLAISNRASAPVRRGGAKSKRTNLYMEVQDKSKFIKGKK